MDFRTALQNPFSAAATLPALSFTAEVLHLRPQVFHTRTDFHKNSQLEGLTCLSPVATMRPFLEFGSGKRRSRFLAFFPFRLSQD